MKKKMLGFLLVLASVIACIVCLAACGNGGASRAEYVGKYEFVSMHVVMKFDDEDEDSVIDYVAGKDGITKDFYTLELKEDGNYVMTIGAAGGTMEGTWNVNGGKLALNSANGSNGSFQNAKLEDGYLIMSSKTEIKGFGSNEQELKLKKVVEEKPAE